MATSSPRESSPLTVAAIAAELPAVASTTATPPMARSASAASFRGVDVVVGTELAGVVGFVGAPVDRDGLEAHRAAELHPEVSKAADAQNGDTVACHCLRLAQRIWTA
jgi:hypothetical protein